MTLLQMSCLGTLMIVMLLLVRMCFRRFLPASVFPILWSTAALRLLIPFSIPLPIAAYQWMDTQKLVIETMDKLSAEVPAPMRVAGINGTAAVVHPEVPGSIWTVVWLIGMLLTAAWFFMVWIRWHKKFRFSLPAAHPMLQEWQNRHTLKRTVSVRQSDQIDAPMTYGILRPVILFPKQTNWDDTETIHYILAHELAHIGRWDALQKLLLTVAVCVHWFNPLVWVMYLLANRDVELACDASVLRTVGRGARAIYARTLIAMEERKRGLMPLYHSFGRTAIEKRITAIMQWKRNSTSAVIVAAVLTLLTVTAFAVSVTSVGAPPYGVNPVLRSVAKLEYGQWQTRFGTQATHDHADFYRADVPGIDVDAVFQARTFDDTLAMAVLTKPDPVVRFEGSLRELLSGVTNSLPPDAFVTGLAWEDAPIPAYTIQTGAKTAYYIADRYFEAAIDGDGDGKSELLLQISLDQTDRITPDSYGWLSIRHAE